MLSSRNKDLIPAGTGSVALETVRTALQAELQTATFCGEPLLDVWINETAGAADGTDDAWDECMEQVNAADLVVVIYNGNAGWTRASSGIGICHAEFERILSRSPSKLRLITLQFPADGKRGLIDPATAAQGADKDKRFADALARAGLFWGLASDAESLKTQVRVAVTSGLVDLARVGSREARKGKYYFGSPLDWSRLRYTERKQVIETSIAGYLSGELLGLALGSGVFRLGFYENDVLFLIHGIPSGFGTAEARDLVGRAYLHDHEGLVIDGRANLLGPVHVFACHKRATESQVNAFFGHPDLVLVQAPFGFFVADPFNFVQAFFLLDCRDDTSTRIACQRMFDWVERSGEAPRIVARAASRARVLRTVAAEVGKEIPSVGRAAAPASSGRKLPGAKRSRPAR
jgi:hypothetical protein